MIVRALLWVFAFWAGAVPFGVLIARWLGVDIREHGSGNIGATNVTRVLGKVPGGVVLLLDAAKGALPTWLALRFCSEPWTVAAAGAFAILGHCFSPFLKFKGGKGVATALGVFVVLAPAQAIIGVGAFVMTFALTRVPALGSLSGALVIAFLLFRQRHESPALAVLGMGTFLLLVITHRGNLARVLTNADE
ncbi:glycerol-3-phosphate 1-O-acyltransferase PlsY [soil metagenome]